MSKATNNLIEELSIFIDRYKYLMLSGGMAVGKTFLANQIVENCKNARFNSQVKLPSGKNTYDIDVEIVPIHPSFSYEDFVSGISIETNNGNVSFAYEDKLLLSMLKIANHSWSIKDGKKYFLVIDDIGRGPISGILGDILTLIEPHGNQANRKNIGNNNSVWLSPNFFIIATRSTLVEPVEQFNYGFFRHFYEITIENDYRFIDDNASDTYTNYDISSNAIYYRSRRIVTDNLRHRYQLSPVEKERYVLGHGLYKNSATMVARYQVVPLLKQYLKDGLLDKTAKHSIDSLQKLVDGQYSKDISFADVNRITIRKTNITSTIFLNEAATHKPLVNLVSRIKEQGLLDDTDITETIMFNPQVLVRKKAKLDGIERTFPSPGYLYIDRQYRDVYTYGKTRKADGTPKTPRHFYSDSKTDVIIVDGTEYCIASEMQPGEYTRWYEDLDVGTEENERYSSSPNSMMFLILRSYYRALDQHYTKYLSEYPEDENIHRLQLFAAQEYQDLVAKTRRLHPESSDEQVVNLRANNEFREIISELVLFWKDKGDTITFGNQTIIVEGVYKVDNRKKYEEFAKAMDSLDIHQMIMQGPPGTSKTYSSREFLKFIGKKDPQSDLLTDDELDSLQIQSYIEGEPLSKWEIKNPNKHPKIAWDIVQFHPSYGYEDFVRGIEVSTIKSADSEKSTISYETVNKILGEMADVANRSEYKDTKFFLVIDEINRANLATVFGELIYGLEYRGKGVATPYTVNNTNKVILPDNLYILGTMNTADKSIGGIDYAIRRRFLFFSLLPDKSTILEYNIKNCSSANARDKQIEINELSAQLFDHIANLFDSENLNNEYYKDDVQIGHTYFMVSSEEQLFLRFRYQIIPILREYYKDGMFKFDKLEITNDGWSGLLGCITGDIDINNEEDKVKDIFEKLVSQV